MPNQAHSWPILQRRTDAMLTAPIPVLLQRAQNVRKYRYFS
jgi:hypothetical protein